MKSFLSPHRLFIFGFVLILLANVIALLGVALNRSGKPEAVIELTERELTLPWSSNDENSGLALHLAWRIVQESLYDNYPFYFHLDHWGSPDWLNEQKLKELGFVIDDATCPKEYSKRKEPLPRDAFIMLEYDGESFQKALQRAEGGLKKAEAVLKGNEKDNDLQDRFKKAKSNLEEERTSRSRLFAIDAGLDADKLRQRYPDRSKFIIMRGIVDLECRPNNIVVGRIADIRIDKINVPLAHRKLFDSILAQKKPNESVPQSPRYKVELAYGSRLEPWIQRVDRLVK